MSSAFYVRYVILTWKSGNSGPWADSRCMLHQCKGSKDYATHSYHCLTSSLGVSCKPLARRVPLSSEDLKLLSFLTNQIQLLSIRTAVLGGRAMVNYLDVTSNLIIIRVKIYISPNPSKTRLHGAAYRETFKNENLYR